MEEMLRTRYRFLKWDRFLIGGLALTLLWAGCSTTSEIAERAGQYDRFGISYAKLSPDHVSGYEMVIVEPGHYTQDEVDLLREKVRYVVAYVSLGEVNPNRWYFSLLKERGFLGVNENWNSHYLNLEDSTTRELMAGRVVPEIMNKGFNGLFLDTVDDVAPYTERSHLQSEMVDLIASIDRNYPDIMIIQNAGLFLLDKTKPYIDAVLVEAIASSYDFKESRYRIKGEREYKQKVQLLQKHAEASKLPFLLVDFADVPTLRRQVRSRLDTLSFPYYIGTIELDSLPEAGSGMHKLN